jgi:hypothetical protein
VPTQKTDKNRRVYESSTYGNKRISTGQLTTPVYCPFIACQNRQ